MVFHRVSFAQEVLTDSWFTCIKRGISGYWLEISDSA